MFAIYCVSYSNQKATSTSGEKVTSTSDQRVTPNKNINKNEKKNINNNNKGGFDELINAYTNNQELKNTIVDFIKMRKTIKKTLSDKGLYLMLKELDKLGSDETTKIEILNQSILHSWQGVFPIKNYDNKAQSGKQKSNFTKTFESIDWESLKE